MRRVICLFLGVIVIYVGLMSTPAFAEQGISITDMENTGNVTVTYRGKGSHHKSGIKIREGAALITGGVTPMQVSVNPPRPPSHQSQWIGE